MNIKLPLFLMVFLLMAGPVAAEAIYQPFVLASVIDAGLDEQIKTTTSGFEQAGFTVAGQYSPVDNTNVIVATGPNLAAEPIWIDVRTMDEYNGGHVSGAVNIPYTEIIQDIPELTGDKDALIYVYCQSGRRSGIAKETLEGLGYTQVVNVGGFEQAMKKSAGEATRETAQ